MAGSHQGCNGHRVVKTSCEPTSPCQAARPLTALSSMTLLARPRAACDWSDGQRSLALACLALTLTACTPAQQLHALGPAAMLVGVVVGGVVVRGLVVVVVPPSIYLVAFSCQQRGLVVSPCGRICVRVVQLHHPARRTQAKVQHTGQAMSGSAGVWCIWLQAPCQPSRNWAALSALCALRGSS